jgi:hypothetical protein
MSSQGGWLHHYRGVPPSASACVPYVYAGAPMRVIVRLRCAGFLARLAADPISQALGSI